MTNKMLMEDWLRGCVHHDGRNGYVTLPCDEVMKIADYIENTRAKVEVVRCHDCKWFGDVGCAIMIVDDSDKPTENDYCSFAERKSNGWFNPQTGCSQNGKGSICNM